MEPIIPDDSSVDPNPEPVVSPLPTLAAADSQSELNPTAAFFTPTPIVHTDINPSAPSQPVTIGNENAKFTQPPTYSPPTNGAKVIKLPVFVDIFLLLGLLIFLAIVSLFSLLAFNSYKQDKNLIKVGHETQAVVVSDQVIEVAGHNNGRTYTPPSYTNNVTYKLSDVPGYTNNSFTDTLSSNSSTPLVQSGQDLPAIYDPANPKDNKLKSNLSTSSVDLELVFAFLPVIAVVAMLIAILTFFRRIKKRNLAIRQLQS